MKIIKKSLLILTVGLFIPTLSGCKKKPLVIPTVDVESIKVSLPALPTRNVGEIRTQDGYDCIDLYELSDFHGAVNYETHDQGQSAYIGLPKLATYLDSKRSANPGGTVVLSCGDMFQGSADSNLTRGYMVNYSMHYMGFDAMAIGNHEFDWTDSWLRKNAELKYNTYSIPYLGANIHKNDELPDYLQKSTVITRKDYKIGVIGVIGNSLENTILKSAIEGYEFVEYAKIVEDEAARLRSEEGCNAVVLLAHEAADQIESLASGSVDAVFGGHAHENKESSAAGGVPALATKNYGQSVARISLKFDPSTKEVVKEAVDFEIEQMIDYGSLAEDSNIKNIMGQYSSSIDEIKGIKLAKCDDELKHDQALKNICTKTMYESAVRAAQENSSAGIDTSKIIAAYHNINGGIRSDIAKGKIIYGDVYKAFPFDNEVVLLKFSGSEYIKNARSLNNLGIYKTFERLSSLKDKETYYIVATDFLALGEYMGDFKRDEGGIKDEDLIRTGLTVRDEVATKIYNLNKIKNEEWAKTSPEYRVVS